MGNFYCKKNWVKTKVIWSEDTCLKVVILKIAIMIGMITNHDIFGLF